MRASPLRVEMGEADVFVRDRLAAARHAPREQRARRGGDVGLPHQAFADEEGARCRRSRQPGEIGGREDAALADDDAVRPGRSGASRSRDRERGLEGVQIAVVDADQPRFQRQRAVELGLVVHLDQRVHAERMRRRLRARAPSRRRPRP